MQHWQKDTLAAKHKRSNRDQSAQTVQCNMLALTSRLWNETAEDEAGFRCLFAAVNLSLTDWHVKSELCVRLRGVQESGTCPDSAWGAAQHEMYTHILVDS